MGLDMYLEADRFIGGQYEHRNVTGSLIVDIDKQRVEIPASKISSVSTQVGYWRKANAIHAWFVGNVQNGVDECQRSYVNRSQLYELRQLVQKELDAKGSEDAGTFLTPREGFFFGSYDIDEWYYQDLEDTIRILDEALAMDDSWDFHYQASW